MRTTIPFMAALTLVLTLIVILVSCGEKDEATAPQNQPPTVPVINAPGGSPPDGSTNQTITPQLCWNCSDPEGDSLFYDVYFDTVDAKTQVSSSQTENHYEPDTLNYSTTYFWKVVAWDKAGNGTTSPVWEFTTVNATGLILSESMLDFGADQTELTFEISNAGENAFMWNLTLNQSWLAANKTSGMTQDDIDTITVMVDRAGMMCDDYEGLIIVAAGNQTDTIMVNMEVSGPPTLVVTPGSLNYLSTESVDTLVITNTTPECATLEWTFSSPQSWISATPSSGSTGELAQLVEIHVNRTGLCEGSHGGLVEITSNGGNADIPVTAGVVVTNLSGSFTASTRCGNAPLSVTFTASISGGVSPYNVSWDFGDGTTGNGLTVTHQYNNVGVFHASATITDKCGEAHSPNYIAVEAVPADFVIVGRDVEFSSYNYAKSGRGGYGTWSAKSYTTPQSAHAVAWADDGSGHNSGAESWAELGRIFATTDCEGVLNQTARISFGIQGYGKITALRYSSARYRVIIYLCKKSDHSVIVSKTLKDQSISRGSQYFGFSLEGALPDVNIVAGQEYEAFVRLVTTVSVTNDVWGNDEAWSDFEILPSSGPRYGVYLLGIHIDFR